MVTTDLNLDLELDPEAILQALGIQGAARVTPVHGGSDTAIWRVERHDRAFALRVFRADQGDACRREMAAMRAAGIGGLPVPAVHAMGTWGGRPALLLDWCPGQTVWAALHRQSWRAWRLGVLLGRMQADIHAIPAPDGLRHPPDSWIDWKGPADPTLAARLRAIGPPRDALLHLDYHPLNVLVDGERVSAVVDWPNAHAGDPRADVARTVAILRLAPASPGTTSLLKDPARRVLEAGWRHGYRQVAGRLGDLTLFYAWAGAVMERDLRPKLDRPGAWLTEADLARIRRWTDHWRARAGLAG